MRRFPAANGLEFVKQFVLPSILSLSLSSLSLSLSLFLMIFLSVKAMYQQLLDGADQTADDGGNREREDDADEDDEKDQVNK